MPPEPIRAPASTGATLVTMTCESKALANSAARANAPCRSMRHRRGGQLGDERVGVEAVERERCDQLRRLPGRDELRERCADDRSCLEAVRAPAGRDVEPVDLRPAEN